MKYKDLECNESIGKPIFDSIFTDNYISIPFGADYNYKPATYHPENYDFYKIPLASNEIFEDMSLTKLYVKADTIYNRIARQLSKPLFEENTYIMEKRVQDENSHVEGVPSQFINSFGNFLGIKYFLEGSKNKENVFSYVNKEISEDDKIELDELFGQCRTIISNDYINYEYYQPDIGYINVKKNNRTNVYIIDSGIGYSKLHSHVEKFGLNIVHEPLASWVTGVDNYGELLMKKFSIKSIYKYNEALYPFMKGENIKDYADKFLKSNSSILLLIGPPGTAKTNFIRQLVTATSESVLLTYSADLKKSDSLFSYFYDSPERFLIVEDADTYIERRADGNSNMPQLLNITDGITANPFKKVIFTTNLPNLSRVDEALLRAGRCYDVLNFGPLKGNDLERAMESIGKEHFNGIVLPENGLTVAELFSYVNGESVAVKEESLEKAVSKFGFGV